MFKRLTWMMMVLPVLFLVIGCSGGDQEEVEYFGEFFLDSDFDKADRVSNSPAIPTSADSSDTAVWSVYNDWGDTDTAAARQSGLAWDANSGLNWNEKYSLWIAGMPKIDFTGWKEMVLDLSAGHEIWGGDKNGKIDYPIAEIILEIGTPGKDIESDLYFDAITVDADESEEAAPGGEASAGE